MISGQSLDLALAIEHLVDRACPRFAVDVPAPRPERAADTDVVESGEHPVGVCHGAGLDREGDPVADRFDQREGGRQLVVVGGVGGMRRDRPLEHRPTRFQVVGDHRANQPVAGQVLVGVDEAGDRHEAGAAEDRRVRVCRHELRSGPDRNDAVSLDRNRRLAQRWRPRVHREHGVGRDDQVGVDRRGHRCARLRLRCRASPRSRRTC